MSSSDKDTIEVKKADKFEPVYMGAILSVGIALGFELIKFLWKALQFDRMQNIEPIFPFGGVYIASWVTFVIAAWFFNPIYKFEKKPKPNQ